MRTFLSNGVWLFCSLAFSPLRFFNIVQVRYECSDAANIKNPVIIASNHRSPLDPLFIGIALFPKLTHRVLPVTAYVAPLHRLQHPGQRIAKAVGFVQAVYFVFDVVRIPEEVTFSAKLAPLIDAVNAGKSALIFPEGRACTKTHVQPFKPGVAELHRVTGAPILPCAVHYYKKGLFSRVSVSFGSPVHIAESVFECGDLATVAEEIRRAVDEQYRNLYNAPRN